MLHRVRVLIALLTVTALPLMALMPAAVVNAADQTVLGQTLTVNNPSTPEKRKIIAKAKEMASDDVIVGNPLVTGATLTVSANGGSASSQTYTLPAGTNPTTGDPFWTGDALKGFKYKDAKGVNGPVKQAQIKLARTVFRIKIGIDGKLGTVAVVPPNPGTDACVLLAIIAGDSYSVRFATGAVTNRGATLFKVSKPTAEGSCVPSTTTSTSTSTSFTSSTTSSTTSTVTSSSTTTSTTLACQILEGQCAGSCADGGVCIGYTTDELGFACACADSGTTTGCGGSFDWLAPSCGGFCPAGQVCQALYIAPNRVCGCVDAATPCPTSGCPLGACPAGEACEGSDLSCSGLGCCALPRQTCNPPGLQCCIGGCLIATHTCCLGPDQACETDDDCCPGFSCQPSGGGSTCQ